MLSDPTQSKAPKVVTARERLGGFMIWERSHVERLSRSIDFDKTLNRTVIDDVDMGLWIPIPREIPSSEPSTGANSMNISSIETYVDMK